MLTLYLSIIILTAYFYTISALCPLTNPDLFQTASSRPFFFFFFYYYYYYFLFFTLISLLSKKKKEASQLSPICSRLLPCNQVFASFSGNIRPTAFRRHINTFPASVGTFSFTNVTSIPLNHISTVTYVHASCVMG